MNQRLRAVVSLSIHLYYVLYRTLFLSMYGKNAAALARFFSSLVRGARVRGMVLSFLLSQREKGNAREWSHMNYKMQEDEKEKEANKQMNLRERKT